MKSMLLYLLQVIVGSGILYAYYHFFLRNKRFHQYNRFYLLAIVCISVVVPFFNIPVYFSDAETGSSMVLRTWQSFSFRYEEPVVVVDGAASTHLDWNRIFFAVYVSAGLVLLFRVILSLYRIRRMVRSHAVEDLQGVRFVNTSEPGTPFSFFKWLFWNRGIELGSPRGEYIFRHEIFHIRQRHSLDIIFLELTTILFWMNPFFHIIKKEVRAIHEFLADHHAANDESKWEYSELLLMQVLNTRQPLVNHFFHNQIKRRIAMITNPQQTSHQYLRKILVLPLAAMIILLFAFRYQSIAAETEVNEKATGVTEMMDATGKQRSDTSLAFLQHLLNVSITVNEVIVEAPGYSDATKNTVPDMIVADDIAYPMQDFINKLKGVSSITANTLRAIPPGNAAALNKYGSMAANGVIELKGLALAKGNSDQQKMENPSIQISSIDPQHPPLIEIDGKIQPREQGMEVLNKLSSGEIGTITLLKGRSALDIYGADAKNGALIVTTKAHEARQRANAKQTGEVVVVGYKSTRNQTDQQKTDEVVVTGYQRQSSGNDRKNTGEAVDKAKKDEVIVTGYKMGTRKADASVVEQQKTDEVVVAGFESKKKPADGQQPGEVVVTGYKKEQHSDATLPNKETTDEVVVTGYKKEKDDKIFSSVEEEASFPGGVEAWRNFIMKNLDDAVGSKRNAPAGTYTIYVQFIVNKEGELSDIKPLTNHGYGMEEEALRVISLSPKWNPARQNGRVVSSYRKQPISFVILKNRS